MRGNGHVLGRVVAVGVEERHRRVEERGIVRGEQILREREQRPEDDVAVRVAGADAALALEEHEPLRPVAVGILRREDAQQQIAERREAAEREQQLDRPLADVARAPAAARVLLEPARREVVDQRIVREPGQDLGDAADLGRRDGRMDGDAAAEVRPERRFRRAVVAARRDRASRPS